MVSKEEYIKEMKCMLFYGQGSLENYLITDIDDQLDIDEFDDPTDYYEARSKGKIVRVDHVLVVWLNGVVFAWNFIHKKDELTNDDIIPDFKKVFDASRLIGTNGNMVVYGEYASLHGGIDIFEFMKNLSKK